MASEVDYCNNALAELGDTATVVSLVPPSGSVQAVHCARFYPIARDELLAMHAWQFATKRVALTLLSETPPASWAYAYQLPSDQLKILAILDPNATDDYSAGLAQYGNISGSYNYQVGLYTTQPFETEIDANGNQVLYSNQQNAVMRYVGRVTDTTTFPPMFGAALTKRLKTKLAGVVIKGAEGRAEAKSAMQEFIVEYGKATEDDANQHRNKPAQSVDWIVNR